MMTVAEAALDDLRDVGGGGRTGGSGSARGPGGFRTYLANTKDPFTSAVLVLPLFLVYQLGILLTGGVRNGVDFVTNLLFAALGKNVEWYLAVNGVVLLGFIATLLVLRRRGHFDPRVIPWMFLETTVYAVLLGSAVVVLINVLGLGGLLNAAAAAKEPPLGLVDKLVMSAGAGLYEELVFRLFLMGGMFVALHKGLSLPRLLSATVALVASSIIFSAAHHISEPFTMSAFTFRVFAGMLFALIFQTRGLAVAAYTHCFYDVWVMVFRN